MARGSNVEWKTELRFVGVVVTSALALGALLWYVAKSFVVMGVVGVVIVTALPLLLLSSAVLLRQRHSALLDRISKWMGIAAFAAAGGYFIYQLTSGQFSTDLEVSVSVDRVQQATQDIIGVVVTLKHQRHSSLRLLDAVACVRRKQGPDVCVPLMERYFRRATEKGKYAHERKIVDCQPKEGGRSPRPVLNAGDQIQLADYITIPAGEPVILDVIVLGTTHIGFLDEQWISSTVSIPETKPVVPVGN
jgi:hypothetical protein